MKCDALDDQVLPFSLFERYVQRRGDDDCWEWQGSIDGYGYGRIGYRRRKWHRLAFAFAHGRLDDGAVIDHLCRNPRCVNPQHLEATTVRVNTARGRGVTAAATRAALLGQCVNGHELALVGTHKQGSGRTCAECGRERVRRYKARRGAA